MTPPPQRFTPITVAATELTVFDGMLYGSALDGTRRSLCAWALPSLDLRWRVPYDGSFVCARGAVRVGSRDGTGRYDVLDPQTGALLQRFELGQWRLTGRLSTDGQTLFHLDGDGVLEALAIDDGALQQSATVTRDYGRIVAITREVVVMFVEYDGLRALDRDTFRQRWTVEMIEPEVVLGPRGALYAGGPYQGGELRAINASTGETDWRVAEAFVPLVCTDALLLSADSLGWVIAHDPTTGEVQWQRWLGQRATVAVGDGERFVVLTEQTLVELDAEGVERARWSVQRSRDSQLVMRGALVVCGDVVIDGARPIQSSAPMPGSNALALSETLQTPENAAPNVPARKDLEAVREVLASVETPQEAWEALAARGLIPASWMQSDARRFHLSTGRDSERPGTLGEILTIASDVEGVARCEALMREAQARLLPWGVAFEEGPTRWRLCGPRGLASVAEGLPGASVLNALYAALGPAAVQSHRVAIDASTAFGWGSQALNVLRLGDAMWRTAVLNDLTWDGAQAERFAARKNPFAPLVEIVAGGYLLDHSGALVACCFGNDLQRPPEADYDDIPF